MDGNTRKECIFEGVCIVMCYGVFYFVVSPLLSWLDAREARGALGG